MIYYIKTLLTSFCYILALTAVVFCIGKSIIFCCVFPLIFLVILSVRDSNYSKVILYDIFFYIFLLIVMTFVLVGISYTNNQIITNITTTKQDLIKLEPEFDSNLKSLVELFQTPTQQDKSLLVSLRNILNFLIEKLTHLTKNNTQRGVNINHANILIFNSYNSDLQNVNRVIRFFIH